MRNFNLTFPRLFQGFFRMKLHKKKKLKSFIRALSQLKKMDLAISNVITDPQAEKTERNTENCISISFHSRSSLNWSHEKCIAKRVVNHFWIWNLDRSLTYSKRYFCQCTLGQEKTNRENCVIRLPTQSWKTMTWHSVMRALKPCQFQILNWVSYNQEITFQHDSEMARAIPFI